MRYTQVIVISLKTGASERRATFSISLSALFIFVSQEHGFQLVLTFVIWTVSRDQDRCTSIRMNGKIVIDRFFGFFTSYLRWLFVVGVGATKKSVEKGGNNSGPRTSGWL
jgi:hypothetical protein